MSQTLISVWFLRISIYNSFIYFFNINMHLSACELHVCQVTLGGQKTKICSNWSYRWLQAAMWLPNIEPGIVSRAASPIYCWDTSKILQHLFLRNVWKLIMILIIKFQMFGLSKMLFVCFTYIVDTLTTR